MIEIIYKGKAVYIENVQHGVMYNLVKDARASMRALSDEYLGDDHVIKEMACSIEADLDNLLENMAISYGIKEQVDGNVYDKE